MTPRAAAAGFVQGTDGDGGEGGRAYGRIRYTEREKSVIRKVMGQLEDGCLVRE